jgi:hypothetical protein
LANSSGGLNPLCLIFLDVVDNLNHWSHFKTANVSAKFVRSARDPVQMREIQGLLVY